MTNTQNGAKKLLRKGMPIQYTSVSKTVVHVYHFGMLQLFSDPLKVWSYLVFELKQK